MPVIEAFMCQGWRQAWPRAARSLSAAAGPHDPAAYASMPRRPSDFQNCSTGVYRPHEVSASSPRVTSCVYTRLYAPEDLEQLETILNLTRELGVNLAGIDIIMNMRRRMREMQEEMQAFVDYVQKEFLDRTEQNREGAQNAMVRINPLQMIRSRGGGK